MCRFQSGLIFKNRIELAPLYNASHSTMLEKNKIEDTTLNASKMFVRAELVPPSEDLLSDIQTWKFIVDQDIIPEWYELNAYHYEDEFRKEVKKWRDKQHIINICGKSCTKIKSQDGYDYYHTCFPIFTSEFGKNNNYSQSEIRTKLLECDFVKNLKQEYGSKLVPVTMNLTSLDGLKDYGGLIDIVGVPDIDLYRECRENIFAGNKSYWLSTPDSTSSGYGASNVQYVNVIGSVDYNVCGWDRGVRPFFVLQSSIV